MAVLIIPDIHNDFARAEAMIAQHAGRFDRVVFLGDYFDDFGDSPEIVLGVAKWLQRSIEQNERIHLIGNHDLAYLAPSTFTRCSGFEPGKMRAIAPILYSLPREKFRAAIEVDGWLLSHAGFHPTLVGGRSAAALVAWANVTLRQLLAGGRPSLFAAGAARGGAAPAGGITWCDWEQEFVPTDGLHQIVGHTLANKVRIDYVLGDETAPRVSRRAYDLARVAGEGVWRSGFLSANVCLDTRLRCAGLVERGRLEFLG